MVREHFPLLRQAQYKLAHVTRLSLVGTSSHHDKNQKSKFTNLKSLSRDQQRHNEN
jgi:hypothetical protein